MPGLQIEALVEGEEGIRTLDLRGRRFVVGRGRGLDIRLLAHAVSRHHLLLVFVKGRWMAQDLNSANGTFVNGRRIKYSEVRPGDSIRFGKLGPIFEVVDSDPLPPGHRLSDTTATRLFQGY